MPVAVKMESWLEEPLEEIAAELLDFYPGVHFANTMPILSEDIWNKFDIDYPEFSETEFENDTLGCLNDIFEMKDDKCIRNHDCMWAGHCASKEHPADEPRLNNNKPTPSMVAPGLNTLPPVASNTKVQMPHMPMPASSQQSLLKPTLRTVVALNVNPAPIVATPQTPPMSDDEETKVNPTQVLQILTEHITENDNELSKYLEDNDGDQIEVQIDDIFVEEEDDYDDDDEEEEIEEKKPILYRYPQKSSGEFVKKVVHYAESDHSYHKDKNASMRMANLGIDTPSDSEEEEIDVVSVGEKQTTTNRMVCSLPNNPSSRDRHQLQRKMATAMSNKKIVTHNVINHALRKTVSNRGEQSPTKRKAIEPRGMKRSRQYRSNNSSPYKRRTAYGNSSDSEPEPSEKRSLHNNMERQRRIDLRNAFEELRLLVPEVNKRDRAAKVLILREAAQYCDHLGKVSVNYQQQVEDLRKQQERLRGRVSQLRRNLAAKR